MHSHGNVVLPCSSDARMTWLHYDWKAWREMNTDGSLSWQRWDPWLLVLRLLHDRGLGNGTSQRQVSCRGRLAMPGGGQRHLNKACSLFNRDPAGWHYGRSASMHIDVLNVTMRSMGAKLSICKYGRRQKFCHMYQLRTG